MYKVVVGLIALACGIMMAGCGSGGGDSFTMINETADTQISVTDYAWADTAGYYDAFEFTASNSGQAKLTLASSDFSPTIQVINVNGDGTLGTVIVTQAAANGSDTVTVLFNVVQNQRYEVLVGSYINFGAGFYSFSYSSNLVNIMQRSVKGAMRGLPTVR